MRGSPPASSESLSFSIKYSNESPKRTRRAVALLEESLEEEENLDETLTEMAEGKSNLEADKEETKPRKTRAASRQ
jgi:hypothetical protein